MLDGQEWTLLILRGAAAALGGVFLWITVRAYLRTRSRSMFLLSAGVLLLVAGTVTEGFAIQGLGLTIDQAHIFESVVWLAAMGMLLASILQPNRTTRRD